MGKSKRSQQRYAKSWRQQTTLDGYISVSTKPLQPAIDIDAVLNAENEILHPLESAINTSLTSIVPQTRRASERDTDSQSDHEIQDAMPPPQSSTVSENGSEHSVGEDSEEESDLHIHGMSEEDVAEEWEDELDNSVQHSVSEIRDWGVL